MLSQSISISFLDWVVFFFILGVTFLSVIYGNLRKKRLGEKQDFLDYLLMGRKLTLPLFVATLVATWYGGIFGVTQIAFESGIYNFVTQGFFWYITYIIMALFLVDRIRSYQAVTLPEIVGKMFGPKSAKVSAVFNFFNVVPIAYTISLGILIQSLFGIEFYAACTLGVAVVLTYSTFGGFRSVVYSDIIQFTVMCSAVALVVLFSYLQFGGLSFLKANLPASHFEATGGHSIATTLVWGFIALATLVDPDFYQRIFAAKSSRIAKRGILISTLVWFCFDICTTLGGMYARAAMPHADSSNAYLAYLLQVLPDGVRGFVLAGILATVLSTLDGFLFIASNTICYDLGPKKWQKNTYANMGSFILCGALSIALAFYFNGNIKEAWKTMGSYEASCLLLPMLYAFAFPGRFNDRDFICSSLFGVIATTYWRYAEHSGFWVEVDALYIGMIATTLAITTSYFLRTQKLFFQK